MGSIPILTVCTGNICRSPVAAAALERHLGARGVAVSVRSSGTQGGISNDPTMLKIAAEQGYDISSHVSRPLDPDEVEIAALVLAMDRGHVQEIVAQRPQAWSKVFTLPELVRRAETLPPQTRVGTMQEWLALAGEGRTSEGLLRGPASDDVEDPHGRSKRKYRDAVTEIDRLTAALSDLLISQVAEVDEGRRF